MFDEISNSISSVFKERIVSPLFGTFFISWILWNWRLLYYFLAVDSKVDVQQRFAYIDQHFINFNSYGNVINLLVGPVLLSALWLWLYPILSGKIETYLAHKRANKLRQIQEIDKTIPLTHEEAMAIYEKAERQEERYAKLSKDYVERIAKLNEKNQQITNRKNSLEESERLLRAELGSTQQQLLEHTTENEKLKTQIQELALELKKTKFGKWADNNETVVEAYIELKQHPLLDKAFATIIATPNLRFQSGTDVHVEREYLEGLIDLGLLKSYKAKTSGDSSIEFSRKGWQLISLYLFREQLEQLLERDPKALKHLPSLKELNATLD